MSILRGLRTRAGLTQSQLARRAQVSERSIRGIESGAIATPQRSTLVALATGLYLSSEDAGRLLRAYQFAGKLRTLSELMAHEALGIDFRQAISEGQLRDVLTSRVQRGSHWLTVGKDRLIGSQRVENVIEVLHDGPVSHLTVQGTDQANDPRLLSATDLVSCRLANRVVNLEQGACAFDFSLSNHARQGDSLAYGYTIQLDTCQIDDELRQVAAGLQASDGYTSGYRNSIPYMSVSVTFEGTAPTRLWELSGFLSLEVGRELVVDDFNTVTVSREHAEPGRYGIGWSWD